MEPAVGVRLTGEQVRAQLREDQLPVESKPTQTETDTHGNLDRWKLYTHYVRAHRAGLGDSDDSDAVPTVEHVAAWMAQRAVRHGDGMHVAGLDLGTRTRQVFNATDTTALRQEKLLGRRIMGRAAQLTSMIVNGATVEAREEKQQELDALTLARKGLRVAARREGELSKAARVASEQQEMAEAARARDGKRVAALHRMALTGGDGRTGRQGSQCQES